MHLKINLGFAIALCVLASATGASSQTALFHDQNLRWEKSPPELDRKFEHSGGTITALHPDGRLLRISSELQREGPNMPIMLVLNSGAAIYSGKWRSGGRRKLIARSRLTAGNHLIPRIGESIKIPGPYRKHEWLLIDGRTPGQATEIQMEEGVLVRIPPESEPLDFDEMFEEYGQN